MQSKTFSLSGEKLRPIREALYSALGPCVDEMDAALERRDREQSCTTLRAYRRLSALGALLDKVGWTQRADATLTIGTPFEVDLLMEVLADELEDHEQQAAGAERPSEDRVVRACQSNGRVLRETLSAVAVEAMVAGLLEKDTSDA